MPDPDDVMIRFGHALGLSRRGERQEARRLFAELWDQVGSEGDPFHRVSLAHAMADVQDDPRSELVWDLRALEAAASVTDERVAQAGVGGPVGGFFPSLHLNLGEDYRNLGDLDAARRHLELGRVATAALADDGYGWMIKRGLAALAERLAADARVA